MAAVGLEEWEPTFKITLLTMESNHILVPSSGQDHLNKRNRNKTFFDAMQTLSASEFQFNKNESFLPICDSHKKPL